MGTAGDWANEWTEKSREQVRRMANRAVSKVFMIGPFCGEGLYNRVGRAGEGANGRGDSPVTFCESVLRKVRNGQKPGPCNSRKKQRFVLLSRTASPVESRLTVESHCTGCATRNGENGKTAAPT